MSPQNLLFTRDHEWIESGNSPARLGISDYAQGELTDVVYVELPKVGAAVKKGEVIVTLESIKATSDIYSPVNGTVSTVNSDLEASPQQINEDPYGKGWLVEITIADPAPLKDLMDFAAYEKYLNSEE